MQFKRILLMVSHSQDFLNGVCTNIVHMQRKQLQVGAWVRGWGRGVHLCVGCVHAWVCERARALAEDRNYTDGGKGNCPFVAWTVGDMQLEVFIVARRWRLCMCSWCAALCVSRVLQVYSGNYDQYMMTRAELEENQMKKYK